MQDIPCPQNPNHADQDPKRVEQGICLVLLENGAPGKQNCIDGVEDPHEHEGTGRPSQLTRLKLKIRISTPTISTARICFRTKALIFVILTPRRKIWQSIPVRRPDRSRRDARRLSPLRGYESLRTRLLWRPVRSFM